MEKANVEIIERCERINYVLVKLKDATYQPYVACWNFDYTDYTWGQGHYFKNKADAEEYIQSVYDRKYDNVLMLEDEYEIIEIWDDVNSILVRKLDGSYASWFDYTMTLDMYVPDDKCCRVRIRDKYYYFG